MNTVSIIIGILFFICILVHWGQGLFKVVVSVASLVLGIVIGIYVAPHLSRYIEKNTLADEKIAAYITEQLEFEDAGKDTSKGVQVAIINGLPLPDEMKESILNNNNSEMYEILEVYSVYDYIAKSVAVLILNAGVFLFLVFFCRMFIYFFIKGLGGFTQLPIVRSIDKIGGALLGAVKGIIYIWIFFVVVSLTSTAAWSQEIITQIGASAPLKLLYDNNILLDIVGDLTRVLFF